MKQIPDWRDDPAYAQTAARLTALKAQQDDLDTAARDAAAAAVAAQFALDDTEGGALAGLTAASELDKARKTFAQADERRTEAERQARANRRATELLESKLPELAGPARERHLAAVRKLYRPRVARMLKAVDELMAANDAVYEVYDAVKGQGNSLPAAESFARPEFRTPTPGLGEMQSTLQAWTVAARRYTE